MESGWGWPGVGWMIVAGGCEGRWWDSVGVGGMWVSVAGGWDLVR